MEHSTTKLFGAVAAGLVFSAGAFAQTPEPVVDTNLGPAVIEASQTESSIFGQTEAEIRRNRALTIAGVAGVVILGAVLLDDDDDEVEEPEPTPHVPVGHHSSSH